MTGSELTQTQALTLHLLKHVVGICEREGIRYYVGGGACIGVVRHGGFIPWDDDVDLSLPREDYERFVAYVKAHPEDGYAICDRHTDSNWHFCMCQYVDMKSEIEIDLAAEKRKAHIWIDIFPLDGLPNSKGARWMHVKHILCLRYLIQLANVRTQVDAHRKRPFVERAVIGASEALHVGDHIDADKDMDRLDDTCRRFSFYEQEFCGNMLGRYREREVVPTAYFGEPKKALFEGFPVNVPERTDEYLTALYGDYMTLPPEDQRVAHNVRVITARQISEEGAEQ